VASTRIKNIVSLCFIFVFSFPVCLLETGQTIFIELIGICFFDAARFRKNCFQHRVHLPTILHLCRRTARLFLADIPHIRIAGMVFGWRVSAGPQGGCQSEPEPPDGQQIVFRFILSSCETGARRPGERSGSVKNAPSDFPNAARRSVTSAIGGLDVSAGA
jgi:hypothetical protein